MKLFILSIFLLAVLNSNCLAQGIKGVINDINGKPVAFASVYVDELQSGTISNAGGVFSYNIPEGVYHIVFRALGYLPEKKEMTITGNQFIQLDIILKEQVYQIPEVKVKPGDEDPAYPIMRKAISLAPYYLNLVKHYNSEVYLKGSLKVIKMPKLLEGKAYVNGHPVRSGDVLMEETLNEISFDAPAKYFKKVVSLKSSFPRMEGENPIDLIQASLYQPLVIDLVSPLSPAAFSYYKFVYEGTSEEQKQNIIKIRVIPRRKNPKLMAGHIYIIENFWNLHSADLQNENFTGTANIKQIYAPVKEQAWLPVSYDMRMQIDAFMSKANVNYLATVKYKNIEINKTLKVPKMLARQYQKDQEIKETEAQNTYLGLNAKQQKKLEDLLAKDKISKRDMIRITRMMQKGSQMEAKKEIKTLEIKESDKFVIDANAFKRDTAYWNTMRPIPLNTDEFKSYKISDSLIVNSKTIKAKNDSTERKKSKILEKLLGGMRVFSKDSNFFFRYHGLITKNIVNFNTVNGFGISQKVSFNWKRDSIRHFEITPQLAYSFNRNKLYGDLQATYNYAPLKSGTFGIGIGRLYPDFNQQDGISPFINTISSLFFRRNYLKLYRNDFISLYNNFEIINGLQFNAVVSYNKKREEVNHTDYSFFYQNSREYTGNFPNAPWVNMSHLESTNSFNIEFNFRYVPHQFYKIKKGVKYPEKSNYPIFSLSYKTAINGVFDSQSRFSYLEGGIIQDVKVGYFSNFKYQIKGGGFFDNEKMHFSEFKHFNIQETPVFFGDISNVFVFPKYYQFSTNEAFFEGHLQFTTPYLFLKFLPFLSKRVWQENLYFNYVNVPDYENYIEAGYGLSQIAFFGTIGVFAGFEDGKYKQTGIKFCIPFGSK